MKYISAFLFLVFGLSISSNSFAQTIVLDENFDDGNYTTDPIWTDNESKHIVNGSNMLQLDAPAETGEAVITTPSSAAFGEWEALVEFEFNPSSSNRARFYLISDTQNLKGEVHGYYIEVGDTDDEVSLYRQDGSSSTKLIDGTDNLVNNDPVSVRVRATRDLNGNWELFADSTGGTSFSSQGTASDNTYTTSEHTGLFSDYTSTRADLFAYDDIKVTKITPPLAIQDVTVINNQTIDITFNLDIDSGSISTLDFSIDNGVNTPDATNLPASNVVRITYNSALPSGKYTITVNNINDTDGNTIDPNTSAQFNLFATYARGDVKINEIMADPPSGQAEYIELINTSDKYLNLADWEIGDETGTNPLGSDPIPLEANGFIVISPDTSALFNTYNNRPYFQFSNLASYNNSGDAVQLINKSGQQVDSLTYTSDWGGNDVALERRSILAGSIHQENWADSPNPNGGTPGLPNEVSQDNTAPHLTALTVASKQTLQLAFTERVGKTGSYTLSSSSINSVSQTAADTVELILGTDLQNAQNYTLTIDGTEDIFGNAIASFDTSFTFYNPTPVDSGDVAINEFMAAPPAGSSEYVEVYNHSNKSLDLQNWMLSDSRDSSPQTITNTQFIVPPDSFVVIAPDNSLQTNYPDIAMVIMADFPSLNNGGDQIKLFAPTGTLLDSLTYTSGWISEEVALERRNIGVATAYQENWGSIPNNFGSPGSANEIKDDTQGPLLSTFTIQSSDELLLTFSERIQKSSSENTSNYLLSSNISIANVRFTAPDSVFLTLDNNLKNAVDYTLNIENIADIFGNSITATDTSFTFYEISRADSGDVFISEFMSVPPSGSTEYVELRNTTSKSFNLQGWTINDNTGNQEIITQQRFILPPDSAIVIAPDKTLKTNYPDLALATMGSSFPSLNNSGDNIVVRNGNGTRLDSLQYDGDWGTDNIALERRSYELSAIFQSNWGEASNGFGTPGLKNSIPSDDTHPILEELTIRNNREILLVFSEYLDPVNAENSSNYMISNELGISTTRFSAPDSVALTLDGNLQNATDYTLSISGITDLFNNTIAQTDTTFTYYEISTVDSGDVAINEFIYIPGDGSSEYIELYNHSDKSLDLHGWTLSDNRESSESPISKSQFIVPPDSFVVVAPDNTIESKFPDISLVIMNDFPALNNGGDQIIIRDQNGTLLDSLAYTSQWGGDETPLERRTTDVTAIYRENWGNAPNQNGTPGRANSIQSDETIPSLSDFAISNPQQLTLVFDERIARSSIPNVQTSISGNNTVHNLSLSPPDTLKLTLTSPLQNATNYKLSIENITDVFGNQLATTDTSFTYYQVSGADSGDIFINEFSFEPPSGSTEYVELYNVSSKSFDLQNWSLSDNRGNKTAITTSQYIIPPDSFVVIAPDNTLLTEFPDIALVSMNNFPALNNSGDHIVIHDDTGSTLDSLQYDATWGGSELALERRTTSVSATFNENWGNAPNGFGTPGTENEVSADQTPPFFETLYAVDPTTLQLVFSEKITESSATNIQNYQISPNRNIQLVSAHNDSVKLFLGSELISGDTYEVTVRNLSDIFGNTLSGATKEFEFLRIDQALPGDIVINEIMYNPGPGDEADFVELYNTTDKNFDISNWHIGDSSNEATLPTNIQLPAHSYIVLSGDDRFVSTLSNGLDVSNFPSYNNNSGDAVYLKTNEGHTIDSLYYSPSWGGSLDGSSLERRDPLAASNDASNWESSDQSSAGAQNISFHEDTRAPEIIFSKILPSGKIEVQFSEFIKLTDEVTFSSGGQQLQVEQFDSTNANVILLSLGTTKSESDQPKKTTVTAQNLSDVKGNTTTSTEIAVAQPLGPADLVINEIMFNPIDDPEDNQPDQSEYIELRNTQDYAISLEGLFLHDAPDEKENVRVLNPVTSTAKWVPAQGKVLVYADANPSFEKSKIATFFDLAADQMQSIMRVDRSSLSLASTDDAIFIADSTGATIDSVFYRESWHNPNIIDTRGIALERVSPKGPSNDEANWGSSVSEKGGTPNSENSIYQENTLTDQENAISFAPNPFSPDNDGQEDKLFLNYKLDQQDYLIDVRIYDRYGRLVRELADGKQAGLEGQLIWDGRKDDGGRNRIGIYIVVFEAYNSSSGSNKSFKETVVLARRLH